MGSIVHPAHSSGRSWHHQADDRRRPPISMTSFTLEPTGPFSLAAARDFAGGFAAGIGAHGTSTGLLMTFPVEGWRDSAAIDVWQTADGTVHGEVAGTGDLE